MTKTSYVCITYIADGKTISAVETCDTANEAIERAEKWRAIRTKANAYRVVVDYETLEIYHYPLD